MAERNVSVRHLQRRDTAATWASTNPTLALGEIGIESDTSFFKIGNGSSKWNVLTYHKHPTLTFGSSTYNGTVPLSVTPAMIGAAPTAHNHTVLTPGNGITGSSYNGSTARTWSIASHAGTAGSIGTINIGATTIGVNLGTSSTTAARGDHTHSYAGSASVAGPATTALALTNAQALKIGGTSKSFNGTNGLTWTLAEIGATNTINHADNGYISVNGTRTLVYAHPIGAGNNHVPTGGAANQILKYSASGVAVWSNEITYTAGTGLTLTGTVFTPTFGTAVNTVAHGNHTHVVSNITDLTTALNLKANLASPTFTGTVSSPTFNATSTTNGGFQGIAADLVTTPSFTWTGDLKTGIWRAAANSIGFTTAGVNRATINATGLAVVGTVTWSGGGSANANTAYTHSQSTHTVVANSATNGSIKINDAETIVYTHPTSNGNKHIPASGAANQILRYSSAGTAVWSAEKNTTYSGGAGITLTGTIFSLAQHTIADHSDMNQTVSTSSTVQFVKVGIGTSPVDALDVSGDARVRGTGALKFGGISSNDSKFEMKYNSSTNSLDFNYIG